MTEDKARLAFVGAGRAALVQYTPPARFWQHAEVVALCDPDPAALERLGPYHPQARHVADYDELLAADDIDGVIILTPTRMHAEQVVKAAKAGKNIMCEKPLAGTIAECEEMIAATDEAGVLFMSAFMKRFDKSMRHVKREIESGSLGEIHTVTCDWHGRPTPLGVADPGEEAEVRPANQNWRMGLGQGGGLLADHGTHTADLVRWWLGDIALVSGEFALVGDNLVDNHATAIYVHESGARSIHMFGSNHERWHESYRIDGTEGTLVLQFGPGASHASNEPFQIRRYTKAGREIVDETLYPHWSMDVETAHFNRYGQQVEYFAQCVREGRQPSPNGLDGLRATEAVSAAYLSSFIGEKVRLPLDETPDLDAMFVEVKRAGSSIAAADANREGRAVN